MIISDILYALLLYDSTTNFNQELHNF